MPLQPFSIVAVFSPEGRWRLAAALVLAALIVPWMSPLHPAPLADWFTDTLTLSGIALAALVPLAVRAEKALTRANLLAWGMILLMVVQHFVNRPAYSGQTWMPLGIFAAMLVLSGIVRDLVSTSESRTRFLDALAIALLISAFVQALMGFLQYIGAAGIAGRWIAHLPGEPSGQVMGNICQRNVFAHMLSLGVVSACWLHARERLRLSYAVALVIFIAIVMAWSGARLPLAYGSGLIGLGVLWWFRARQDAVVLRFCRAAWIFGALVLAMQWAGVWVAEGLWHGFGVGVVPDSGFGRLFEVSPTQRRWTEWAKALGAFSQHPVFGLGWGGLAHHSAYTEAYGNYVKVGDNTLCLHAHNLVLQMLAETGLVGAVISLGGIAWCLWPCLRRATIESVFLLGLAMVTLIHSQFEYPLWYVTGLATFVVVLSCASPEPVGDSLFRPLLRRFAVIVTSAVLLIHAVTGWGAFMTVVRTFGAPPEVWPVDLGPKLYALQSHPLWAAEAELALAIHLIPAGEPVDAKRKLLERQAGYRPYGPIMLKLALLRAIQGDTQGADQAVDILVASFPDMIKPFFDYIQPIQDPAIDKVKARLAEVLAKRAQPARR